MSYTQTFKQWGQVPLSQTFETASLQASSDGVQEIEFEGCNEIHVKLSATVKSVVATSSIEAASKIVAGEYYKLEDGESGSFFREDGKSLFVLNSQDEEIAEAITLIRYFY